MENAFPECQRIEARLAKLQSEIEAGASSSHGEAYERMISEFTSLTEKFREIGGYEYKSRIRSYRELPCRWAELGTVYRYEKSGALYGLLRVRGFTQDDAHIICTPEQIEDEIARVLEFSLSIWKDFGFTEIKPYLATRPAKAVGDPARWEQALNALSNAVKKAGL